MLSHLRSKNMFPGVQVVPPMFQFVPIGFSPVTENDLKEPGFILYVSSIQVFVYINEILPEPSQG